MAAARDARNRKLDEVDESGVDRRWAPSLVDQPSLQKHACDIVGKRCFGVGACPRPFPSPSSFFLGSHTAMHVAHSQLLPRHNRARGSGEAPPGAQPRRGVSASSIKQPSLSDRRSNATPTTCNFSRSTSPYFHQHVCDGVFLNVSSSIL